MKTLFTLIITAAILYAALTLGLQLGFGISFSFDQVVACVRDIASYMPAL